MVPFGLITLIMKTKIPDLIEHLTVYKSATSRRNHFDHKESMMFLNLFFSGLT